MSAPGSVVRFPDDGLVAVFAHPDDESLAAGGLLAWCASLGVRVSLICLTRGERGRRPAGADPDALARLRQRELDAAAAVLGIDDVVLLGHEDGLLPWLDAGAIEAEIARLIAERAPTVVVTFDTDGLYWHPDHIAVHERTVAAVRGRAIDPTAGAAAAPDPPALYHVTVPEGAMRTVTRQVGSPPGSTGPPHVLGVTEIDAFGAGARSPTLVLDVGPHARTKLRALRCHASQMAGSVLDAVPVDDAHRLLGVEHYRRADDLGPRRPFIERLGAPRAATVVVATEE